MEGQITPSEWRFERMKLKQLTSDPSNPQPGDEWLRVDQKPSYEDADGNTRTAVAQYRRVQPDGTTITAPVAQLGDPTGSDVIDKVRANITDGGSPTGKGFVPYVLSSSRPSYPKRRLQHPVDGQVGLHDALTVSTIPDARVAISLSSTGSANDQDFGIAFSSTENWADFQSRFDPNTQLASDEEMVLYDINNSTELDVLDASGNSPGDVLTFEGVNLSAGTDYAVYGRAPTGSARDQAFDNSLSYPINSGDGKLSITNGWFEGSTNSQSAHISEIGNINL